MALQYGTPLCYRYKPAPYQINARTGPGRLIRLNGRGTRQICFSWQIEHELADSSGLQVTKKTDLYWI